MYCINLYDLLRDTKQEILVDLEVVHEDTSWIGWKFLVVITNEYN